MSEIAELRLNIWIRRRTCYQSQQRRNEYWSNTWNHGSWWSIYQCFL